MAGVRPMSSVFEYDGTIVVNPTSRRSNGHAAGRAAAGLKAAWSAAPT